MKGKIFSFPPEKEIIKIGRKEKLDIVLTDESLSQVQCCILFDKMDQ